MAGDSALRGAESAAITLLLDTCDPIYDPPVSEPSYATALHVDALPLSVCVRSR